MSLADLLTTAGHVGIRLLADGVRNQRVQPDPKPDNPGDHEGCPACSVHRELAEAERLLTGVLRSWQGSEPAPSERRSTVLLVESNLDIARDRLRSIKDARPPVLELLGKLRSCINEARAALPERSNTNRGDWERAHQAVTRCWEMADDFAGEWFRPQPPAGVSDELEARVRALGPEDRRRLLEVLEG